jgi:hypothetical protein
VSLSGSETPSEALDQTSHNRKNHSNTRRQSQPRKIAYSTGFFSSLLEVLESGDQAILRQRQTRLERAKCKAALAE